jgi:hypothetical protein
MQFSSPTCGNLDNPGIPRGAKRAVETSSRKPFSPIYRPIGRSMVLARLMRYGRMIHRPTLKWSQALCRRWLILTLPLRD